MKVSVVTVMVWELSTPYGDKQVFSNFPNTDTWSREPPAMSCVLPRMVLIECMHIPFNFLSAPMWTNWTEKKRLLSVQIVTSAFVLPSFLSKTSQVPVLMRP